VVKYGGNGAEFTFARCFDAPHIWSSFYFLFSKVEVTIKAAGGTGIVTDAVLMSDCLNEMDWEWSGSNFGSPHNGKVQTNVFGKGITGNYDRGTQPPVDAPTSSTIPIISIGPRKSSPGPSTAKLFVHLTTTARQAAAINTHRLLRDFTSVFGMVEIKTVLKEWSTGLAVALICQKLHILPTSSLSRSRI
jgi:hypothetical protein